MREYSLGLYEKSMPHSLSLAEKLTCTRENDFDFLEVSIDESDEKLSRLYWGEVQRREVSEAICETGVAIGSMCLSVHRKYPLGSTQAATRQKSLDIMARALDLACCWGIRVIQLAGYDVYYEESSKETGTFFAENLSKSVDMAAKAGVVLAFETMETPFMDTMAKAMAYIKAIGSPWLQVYPDLGNLTNAAILYDHAISEDIASGWGHIAAMHLKETIPGHYRDIPFGTGHVDFARGIATASSLGVRRFVGEFWDSAKLDYRVQIEHACRFLRKEADGCIWG